MKKIIIILMALSCHSAHTLYHGGAKLKYTDVEITNKSTIPLTLKWVEIDKGNPRDLTREMAPGEKISVKIGEVGNYFPNKPAKIVYYPIEGNEKFETDFTIDLPNSKEFVITAVKMADIMNKLWVPGVLKANDKGEFDQFQYMNLGNTFHRETVLQRAGEVQQIQ